MDIGSPACSHEAQGDHQVCRGQQRRGLVRPFDQPDAIAIEVFVQACIEEFSRVGQPIEIKVIEV